MEDCNPLETEFGQVRSPLKLDSRLLVHTRPRLDLSILGLAGICTATMPSQACQTSYK